MYYAGSPAALFAAKQNVKRGEFGAEGSNGRLGLHPYEAVCLAMQLPALHLECFVCPPESVGPYACAEMDTFATALNEHRSSMRAIFIQASQRHVLLLHC